MNTSAVLDKRDNLNIIGVFAHPDDELCAAGTFANHADAGDDVTVVYLTHGENVSTISGSKNEIIEARKIHADLATKVIGSSFRFLDLPDSGIFPSVENARKLARVFRELQPDIIFTWNQPSKIGPGHPDHRYTHQIVLDALSYARLKDDISTFPPHRKPISLYTTVHYETLMEDLDFVDVTHQYDRIIKLIKVYQEAYGTWSAKDHKDTLMKFFGEFSGSTYAEAFKKLIWRCPYKLLS